MFGKLDKHMQRKWQWVLIYTIHKIYLKWIKYLNIDLKLQNSLRKT